jgi:hypothetical protein
VTSDQCASGPVAVRRGPAFRPWDTDTGSPEARVAYREMTMRALAAARRSGGAFLLLPVRESKSINNVGTSFAINRVNKRTIDAY